MDTLSPGLLGRGKGSLLSCRVEVFLKEFKRDAVAMYENDPGASMSQVSKDLGINRATLRYWIDQFGTGMFGTCILKRHGGDREAVVV